MSYWCVKNKETGKNLRYTARVSYQVARRKCAELNRRAGKNKYTIVRCRKKKMKKM